MPKRHRAVLCYGGMYIVFVCDADEEAEAEARNQKQMYLDWSFVNVCVSARILLAFIPLSRLFSH